ncbi:MAG: glucosidase, partial [Abditibacteriaceae bacterium]
MNAEQKRLKSISKGDVSWRKWGTYLAERAWGTVREDYSAGGTAWDYFPHDHARSRAYRWNEDGLLGFCDDGGYLCFGLSLWNGEDAILKERAFGLNNTEGNHGEDVKEYFYYLDNLPTHSYCRALYKYPQNAFPYSDLVNENKSRGQNAPEYELIDTGVFDQNRYFDVQVEYAKNTPTDILIQISVTNRGGESARLELLPTFTFRNIWDWKHPSTRPQMKAVSDEMVQMEHPFLGNYTLYCQSDAELLFTENHTNDQRLYQSPNDSPFVKDAFHEYLIHENKNAINPQRSGTKMAARYTLQIEAGETQKVLLRLVEQSEENSTKSTFSAVSKDFDAILQKR